MDKHPVMPTYGWTWRLIRAARLLPELPTADRSNPRGLYPWKSQLDGNHDSCSTFAGPPDSASQNGTANNIAVVVFDQTTAGTWNWERAVPNVPVKFDVASATGGFLIPKFCR